MAQFFKLVVLVTYIFTEYKCTLLCKTLYFQNLTNLFFLDHHSTTGLTTTSSTTPVSENLYLELLVMRS